MALSLAIPLGGVAQAQRAAPPANAVFYADCFAASAAARSYERDGGYLRFRCYGPSARTFFEALGARAADRAYEERRSDGVHCFTQKPKKDTVGLDHCWRAAAPASPDAEYGCELIFPAGAFLDG